MTLPYDPRGCPFCEVMPPLHRPHCPAYVNAVDAYIARLEEQLEDTSLPS